MFCSEIDSETYTMKNLGHSELLAATRAGCWELLAPSPASTPIKDSPFWQPEFIGQEHSHSQTI